MRVIIAPVDFSTNACNAAHYAADIALATGSEIRLVHILQPPSIYSQHPMPDFLFKELQDSGYDLLNSLRTALLERTGGKIRVLADLEIGNIDHQLTTYCKRHKPFMTVIGTSSSISDPEDGADHASKALKKLPYPVLVLPKETSFYGAPKVLVACDNEDIHSGLRAILPFLKELRETLGTKLEIVHIIINGENIKNVLEDYHDLKEELQDFGPGFNVVRQKSIEAGINDYLRRHPADWLLVLPKRHSLLEFHKSRAADIIQHSPVPVLWLHE